MHPPKRPKDVDYGPVSLHFAGSRTAPPPATPAPPGGNPRGNEPDEKRNTLLIKGGWIVRCHHLTAAEALGPAAMHSLNLMGRPYTVL
eukprot:9504074-Pyramimonas_sp.AAC.1